MLVVNNQPLDAVCCLLKTYSKDPAVEFNNLRSISLLFQEFIDNNSDKLYSESAFKCKQTYCAVLHQKNICANVETLVKLNKLPKMYAEMQQETLKLVQENYQTNKDAFNAREIPLESGQISDHSSCTAHSIEMVGNWFKSLPERHREGGHIPTPEELKQLYEKLQPAGLLDSEIDRFNVSKLLTEPRSLKSKDPQFLKLQTNKDLVLVLVAMRGSALKGAHKTLKDDRDVVLAAIGQSAAALQYANDKLRNDPEVVLAAVTKGGVSALEYAGKELLAKPDFMKQFS